MSEMVPDSTLEALRQDRERRTTITDLRAMLDSAGRLAEKDKQYIQELAAENAALRAALTDEREVRENAEIQRDGFIDALHEAQAALTAKDNEIYLLQGELSRSENSRRFAAVEWQKLLTAAEQDLSISQRAVEMGVGFWEAAQARAEAAEQRAERLTEAVERRFIKRFETTYVMGDETVKGPCEECEWCDEWAILARHPLRHKRDCPLYAALSATPASTPDTPKVQP